MTATVFSDRKIYVVTTSAELQTNWLPYSLAIVTSTNDLYFFDGTTWVKSVGGLPAAHIVDADGTLADITTKFNTLLAALETLGLLKTS